MQEHLVKQNAKGIAERMLRTYMIGGKDVRVLHALFSMNGKIDAFMIETGEMKVI